MKQIFLALIMLIICVYWCIMGVYIGIKYEEANQYTETRYVYKNMCLAMYKGAWLPYDCMDSTIESK